MLLCKSIFNRFVCAESAPFFNRNDTKYFKKTTYCTEKQSSSRTENDLRKEYDNIEKSLKQNENTEDRISDLIKKLTVSREERDSIENITRGQVFNKYWDKERKFRLTASKFGEICKRKNNLENLATRILNSSSFEPNNFPMQYGLLFEDIALQDYEETTGTQVTRCGIFIDLKRGHLAASPDGIIGDDKVIEVKCPFRAKDMTPIEAAIYLNNPKFYCSLNGLNSLSLSRNHNYYYQVQGQLAVTGRNVCDFVVWTPYGIHIEPIPRDDIFISKMYKKLDAFYKEHLAPRLVQIEEDYIACIKDANRTLKE